VPPLSRALHGVAALALGSQDDVYAEHYASEATTPPTIVASLERVVSACAPYRTTRRWLDVGCGRGDLLEIAQRHGFTCYGTEVAASTLENGAARGWIVGRDPDRDERFPAQGFDVVTMIEVLERVPEPRHLLDGAARWLRPGGLLYLTTPNAGSLNRRLLGLEWSIVLPPEHLTLWTARALERALSSTGFAKIRLRTEGLNPSEIVARARGTLRRPSAAAPPPVDRNEAGRQLSAAMSASPLRRAVKTGINHCLSGLRLGDTLKAWAVRGSTRVEA
jgi:2-polyprenyl-3-methyl-5-hydroxy-6-metoxy-1,4-benzoquinol methylase